MSRWKLAGIQTPAGMIPSVMSRGLNPGLDDYVQKGDGRISPHFAALMRQAPTCDFSTPCVGRALAAIGVGFYGFDAPVSLYFARLGQGAGILPGAVHAVVRGIRGAIVPRKITAGSKDVANFEAEIFFITPDGDTPPLAYVPNVALPNSLRVPEAYAVGPVSINGTRLQAVESWELDFGINARVESGGGDLYPNFTCYDAIAPTLTTSTADAGLLDLVGLTGVAQNGTPSTWHLRKLSPDGRVPNGTSEHVRLTMLNGRHRPDKSSADDDDLAKQSVVSTPIDDGVNGILAVSLASSIVG